VSPLKTGLKSRPGISPLGKVRTSRRRVSSSPTRPKSPPSPCNLYIGENFAVRFNQYFKLLKLVKDNQNGGVVHTEFDPFRATEHMRLSDSAKKIRDVPNAGGNSVVSEVLSFELMQKCFGAELLKTEMEVSYWPEGGSITDYTCTMFGTSLGVSVTRAMKYKGPYTQEDAERLLTKKLNGVVQSSKNSLEKWSKQILHIWATSADVANIVTQMYDRVPNNVKSNTVVLVTVAKRCQDIFANK